MARDYQIKKRVSAKRARVSAEARAKQPPKPKQRGMIPLLRCAMDSHACPASGSVVAILSGDERHSCIVCGRSVRIRAKHYRNRGQYLGRIPTHRRADEEVKNKARERESRLRCRFERAEATARDALSRRAIAKAAGATKRARAIAERLPNNERRNERLNRLDARILARRANAERDRFAMPKDPKRLLGAIIEASGFDVTAAEPDGWIDHISAALPERMVIPIAKQPSTRWIRAGLEALLRWSKPKSWDDLERRGFAGDRSVMAFIREFPGLELLRIPDRAYEGSVTEELMASGQYGDIPF